MPDQSDADLLALLDRLEALAAAATDGPWEAAVGGIYRDCRKPGLVDHRADLQTAWTWQDSYKSGARKGMPKGTPQKVAVATGIMLPCLRAEDAEFAAASREA